MRRCQLADTKPERYCSTEKLNTVMTDHGHLFDTHPNLKVFAPFLDDLNRESERGAVLISVSLFEWQQKEIVSAFLCEGEASERLLEGFNAPLGTLSASYQNKSTGSWKRSGKYATSSLTVIAHASRIRVSSIAAGTLPSQRRTTAIS